MTKAKKITRKSEMIPNVPVALLCSKVGNPKDVHLAACTLLYYCIYGQSVKLLEI